MKQECKNLLSNNFKAIKSEIENAFLKFDEELLREEVINKMYTFKKDEKTTRTEDEQSDEEERGALLEEAMALSKEANVSLDTIVKQYTKISEELSDASSLKNV